MLPVASSLESYPFFKAPGKPHCLHNLPNRPQARIFAQFSLVYLTRLISSLGDYKPLESRACVTLNNSHLLSAYCVPATVGDT